MSIKKTSSGTLRVPPKAKPEPHELTTAMVLVASGKDVTFVIRNEGYKIRSADIFMDGVQWEIKSPTGKSRKTISRHIKTALGQSRCIIIDTSRTKLLDERIEKWLRDDLLVRKSIKRLKLITKKGEIIDIK